MYMGVWEGEGGHLSESVSRRVFQFLGHVNGKHSLCIAFKACCTGLLLHLTVFPKAEPHKCGCTVQVSPMVGRALGSVPGGAEGFGGDGELGVGNARRMSGRICRGAECAGLGATWQTCCSQRM